MLTCNMSFIRLQLANLGQFTRFEQVPDVSLFRVELLAKDISNLLEAGSQESCLDPMLWWHGIIQFCDMRVSGHHDELLKASEHELKAHVLHFPFAVGCLCWLKWAYWDPAHDFFFWEVSCPGQGWNAATRSLVGFSSFTSNFDLLSLYFHVFPYVWAPKNLKGVFMLCTFQLQQVHVVDIDNL